MANIVLLTVLGVLFLMSYERPAAFVFADLAWLVAPVLVNFVRFTDPTWIAARCPADGGSAVRGSVIAPTAEWSSFLSVSTSPRPASPSGAHQHDSPRRSRVQPP